MKGLDTLRRGMPPLVHRGPRGAPAEYFPFGGRGAPCEQHIARWGVWTERPNTTDFLPKLVLWWVRFPRSVSPRKGHPLGPDRYRGDCLMLTLPSVGIRAEGVFRRCLRRARIEQVEHRFEPRLLIGNALTHGSRRLQQVLKHRNVGKAGAAEILDHVYGLDHVIDVGDGVLIGIDITLDATKVASKVRKASDLRNLSSRIGIHSVYIVQLVGDVTDPDFTVVDQSIEQFWELLADHLNSSRSAVHSCRFHIS